MKKIGYCHYRRKRLVWNPTHKILYGISKYDFHYLIGNVFDTLRYHDINNAILEIQKNGNFHFDLFYTFGSSRTIVFHPTLSKNIFDFYISEGILSRLSPEESEAHEFGLV